MGLVNVEKSFDKVKGGCDIIGMVTGSSNKDVHMKIESNNMNVTLTNLSVANSNYQATAYTENGTDLGSLNPSIFISASDMERYGTVYVRNTNSAAGYYPSIMVHME